MCLHKVVAQVQPLDWQTDLHVAERSYSSSGDYTQLFLEMGRTLTWKVEVWEGHLLKGLSLIS